jgi:hypothetical protein
MLPRVVLVANSLQSVGTKTRSVISLTSTNLTLDPLSKDRIVPHSDADIAASEPVRVATISLSVLNTSHQ